ncbi:VPS35 endosomal protein sorting factor-like [Anthonomus grandis grandis]|uniref:VPS35 endosomal protein sorting factor-like n=1 Tax=Anthonomus grandis grandis TaxID=2921223 RepID=UPI002165246B|nr:VPS35 endosomal protein sorting factor-like [Anthonomus grandis grandis]
MTTLRDKRIRKLYAHSEPTFDHPLKSMLVVGRIPRRVLGSGPSTGRATPVSTSATISEPLAQALKKLDPLSQIAIPEEMDPLSKMAAEMDTVDSAIKYKEQSTKSNPKSERQDSWSHRKAAILQKYTTSEKLSMVTSFLQEGEKVAVKAQSTAVDKVQHRLEQLDSFEEGPQRKLDLSQTEYIFKIDQLHKELILAWNIEQRIKALKIAIQCAKMLADTDVLPFYPSKFVLITDILDCFGKLVYDRLHSKAMYYKPGSQNPIPLPENFTPNMVSDQAKETCLNWFFKIASIRELVPRLYIEMALLNSYSFISAK